MRQRLAAAVAAIGGLGLLIAGCGGTSSAAPSSGSKVVRLIQGGGLDFSDAAIYKAMALLKARGYKVSLANVADPATALRSVLAGKADVYLGAPVEAATAVANGGAQVKYLASLAQTSNYEIIALPKFTVHNLGGARLATAGPGTAGQIVGVAALQRIGVPISQIHQVTVGGTSARVTAILAGQVDLAPVLAPDAVSAVATGKVKILLNAGSVLGDYLQQGLIASSSFAASTATAQATVTAFLDAERWADSMKPAISARRTPTDSSSVSRPPRSRPPGSSCGTATSSQPTAPCALMPSIRPWRTPTRPLAASPRPQPRS